jgi:hypothetical protein
MQNVNKRADWLTLFALVLGTNIIAYPRTQTEILICDTTLINSLPRNLSVAKTLLGSKT